jgi:hypothetical protein
VDASLRKCCRKLLEEVRRKSHVLNIVAATKKGSQERSFIAPARTINVRAGRAPAASTPARRLAKWAMVGDNLGPRRRWAALELA